MTHFDSYANRYEHLRMERRDGILQVTLHSAGETLRWGLDRVPVQAGDRAQPPRDRRSCSAKFFELPSKAFDVVAGDVEQSELSLLTPRRKLAQIQGIGITGQSRVSAQEAEQRLLLDRAEDAIRATLQRQSWRDHLWIPFHEGMNPNTDTGLSPRTG